MHRRFLFDTSLMKPSLTSPSHKVQKQHFAFVYVNSTVARGKSFHVLLILISKTTLATACLFESVPAWQRWHLQGQLSRPLLLFGKRSPRCIVIFCVVSDGQLCAIHYTLWTRSSNPQMNTYPCSAHFMYLVLVCTCIGMKISVKLQTLLSFNHISHVCTYVAACILSPTSQTSSWIIKRDCQIKKQKKHSKHWGHCCFLLIWNKLKYERV